MGTKINMGAIIANNIFEKVREVGGPLCYPGLVKRLCERAGVPMNLFEGEGKSCISLDPPIPVPEGIARIDPTLFIELPDLFRTDTGASEYSTMRPKIWGRRSQKPSYFTVELEQPRDAAGPSVPPQVPVPPVQIPVPDPVPAPPAQAPVTSPVQISSQTVTQPEAQQPMRRLESSEGSRSVRQRKQAPKRRKTAEEERAEQVERKKAKFRAQFNVQVEPATRARREERQAREARIVDMTIPAGIQDQSAVDVSPSPPPTTAQLPISDPPSVVPSSTVPLTSEVTPTTQPDPGAVALQLIQKMMEEQKKKEEEKEIRRREKEKEKAEELKKQEETRKEELRRIEESTQAKLEKIEEVRKEEMRKEREARTQFEVNVNESLKQTANVLSALFDKITNLGAVPITGPVPPPQSALPSRPGEGTSQNTGTTESDTPVQEIEKPPSQSQEEKKDDGGEKEKSAD